MHAETPMSAELARRLAQTPPEPRSAPATEAGLGDRVLRDLEAMRDYLAARHPASGNEALKLLRSAFPDVPLDIRVKAAADRRTIL